MPTELTQLNHYSKGWVANCSPWPIQAHFTQREIISFCALCSPLYSPPGVTWDAALVRDSIFSEMKNSPSCTWNIPLVFYILRVSSIISTWSRGVFWVTFTVCLRPFGARTDTAVLLAAIAKWRQRVCLKQLYWHLQQMQKQSGQELVESRSSGQVVCKIKH